MAIKSIFGDGQINLKQRLATLRRLGFTLFHSITVEMFEKVMFSMKSCSSICISGIMFEFFVGIRLKR